MISFIHDSKTFKENNTLFKPKIEYRIESWRNKEEISKGIDFFLKMGDKNICLLCCYFF